MTRDIDAALEGWEFQPGIVQARLVVAADQRQVIQMRVDLGVLQMEVGNRPDGERMNSSSIGFRRHLRWV